ncbi:MAG: DUF3800 domain-containing protein [Nitrososphaeraceae archaeon]
MINHLYKLYIDESGDEGDYLDATGRIIEGSSQFFSLGGIIVKDESRESVEKIVNEIILNFFPDISLPPNFKLHYHALRQKKYP